MYKLKPKDLIALTIITGTFVLEYYHPSQYLNATLTGIIGWYFGHRQSGNDSGH